jgi:hypothetical protein
VAVAGIKSTGDCCFANLVHRTPIKCGASRPDESVWGGHYAINQDWSIHLRLSTDEASGLERMSCAHRIAPKGLTVRLELYKIKGYPFSSIKQLTLHVLHAGLI